jgi:uncharacterized protein (DUF1800 family)
MLTGLMRIVLATFAFVFACAANAAGIGYEGARHLLNRTGFGATDAEIAEFASLDRATAVDRILAGARREAATPPPEFVEEAFQPYYRLRGMSAEERMAAQRKLLLQSFELRAWWLREMVSTPSPLTERMTLFWHNHFATSQQKVRSVQLMYRQNVLLRREALGNFSTLLRGIAKDPAMLVYLDNAGSRRQAPNENFAREVMELFTLGEGHYTEHDIKEAARAFTGWSLDRETGDFTYRRIWHDYGEKTVFGRAGRLEGDDVLDLLLARPETSQFIVAKLWREFVSQEPQPGELARLATAWREARYEVKPLLRELLNSDAFWSTANRGALVKSPVELVAGTLRTFEIHPTDLRPAVFACAALGQNLFAPPNVKGWPGGQAWIDSSTLLARQQFIDRVFRGSDPVASAVAMRPAARVAPGRGGAALRRMLERGMADYVFDAQHFGDALGKKGGERLQSLVLAYPPVGPIPGETPVGDRVRALVADASYQLK